MKEEIYTSRQSCLALKIAIGSVNEAVNKQFMTALYDCDTSLLKPFWRNRPGKNTEKKHCFIKLGKKVLAEMVSSGLCSKPDIFFGMFRKCSEILNAYRRNLPANCKNILP